MKIFLSTTGIMSLGLIFLLSACDSDDDKTPSKTVKEYLTSGFWKTTAKTIDPGIDQGDGTVITDLYAQWDECQKDDLIRFNMDGTITDDEGVIKCDTNNPQTVNDRTWELSDDNKSLSISHPDEGTMIYEILELNDKTFIRKNIFFDGNLNYAISTTMQRL
jgi:hypothetical protein